MIVVDNPARYTVHRWPRPRRTTVKWIIVHDPAIDKARPEVIMAALRRNAREVSYHELVARYADGVQTRVLCPAAEWVGHAGEQTRIPGTAVINRSVNHWTYGLSVATYGKQIESTDPELWQALVDRLVDLIHDLDLPDAGIVLGHREGGGR